MAKNTDLSILQTVMILNQQTRHQRRHCALCHQYPDSKNYCNAVIFHNYSDTFPDHYRYVLIILSNLPILSPYCAISASSQCIEKQMLAENKSKLLLSIN